MTVAHQRHLQSPNPNEQRIEMNDEFKYKGKSAGKAKFAKNEVIIRYGQVTVLYRPYA